MIKVLLYALLHGQVMPAALVAYQYTLVVCMYIT